MGPMTKAPVVVSVMMFMALGMSLASPPKTRQIARRMHSHGIFLLAVLFVFAVDTTEAPSPKTTTSQNTTKQNNTTRHHHLPTTTIKPLPDNNNQPQWHRNPIESDFPTPDDNALIYNPNVADPETPPNDFEQANFNQFLGPANSQYLVDQSKAIYTNACRLKVTL